jgi:hypothetical protein
MTPEQLEKARRMLGLTQTEMGQALGWTGPKHIQNLELGHRPITKQTALAVECLLRRAGSDWSLATISKSHINPKIRIPEYKCDHAGIVFMEDNEAYTTQTCSCCGERSANAQPQQPTPAHATLPGL